MNYHDIDRLEAQHDAYAHDRACQCSADDRLWAPKNARMQMWLSKRERDKEWRYVPRYRGDWDYE